MQLYIYHKALGTTIIADDFCCQFGIGGRKFGIVMNQSVMAVRPTPLQSVRSKALSSMTVEYEVIYLSIHKQTIVALASNNTVHTEY